MHPRKSIQRKPTGTLADDDYTYPDSLSPKRFDIPSRLSLYVEEETKPALKFMKDAKNMDFSCIKSPLTSQSLIGLKTSIENTRISTKTNLPNTTTLLNVSSQLSSGITNNLPKTGTGTYAPLMVVNGDIGDSVCLILIL